VGKASFEVGLRHLTPAQASFRWRRLTNSSGLWGLTFHRLCDLGDIRAPFDPIRTPTLTEFEKYIRFLSKQFEFVEEEGLRRFFVETSPGQQSLMTG
jgi:hypothetical protein